MPTNLAVDDDRTAGDVAVRVNAESGSSAGWAGCVRAASHQRWFVPFATALLGLACALAVLMWVVRTPWEGGWGWLPFVDTEVYRLGGQVFLDSGNLYGPLPPTSVGIALPFTYPPLAAALFTVLAVLPTVAAGLLMTLTSVGCLLWLVAVVGSQSKAVQVPSWRLTHQRAAFLAVLVLLLVIDPVAETLRLGQINLILMMLVAADVLLPRTWWPRGTLIGLAAAIKLTPLAFVLFFVGRRQWRASLTVVAASLGFSAAGWALAPRASEQYWTQVLWSPERIGDPIFHTNQSLMGMLSRLGMDGTGKSVLWLAVVGGLGVITLLLAHWSRTTDQPMVGLGAVSVFGLLASPVSWSHHWVWLPLAALGLLLCSRWMGGHANHLLRLRQVMWWWGVAAFPLAIIGCHRFLPQRNGAELHWSWWQQVVGNGYVLWGLGSLVLLAWVGHLTRRLTISIEQH